MNKVHKKFVRVVHVGFDYGKVEIVTEQGQTLEYELPKGFCNELEDALYRAEKAIKTEAAK